MTMQRKKLFCEINPFCYAIALRKEILKRHIKDFFEREPFAKTIQQEKLPVVVSEHSSHLIKRGKGIDSRLQEGKAVNIRLACEKINGLLIRPGEVFSFWKRVGNTTKRKGYQEGRVISGDEIKPGLGGGLCNLANTIHWIVLHSPLEVTEFHQHSDALAPNEGKRMPFSSGTSVCYNNVDYRFKNTTGQNVQLLVWCDEEELHAQLRSEKAYPWQYELMEEDHHFAKEGEKYYRNSRIYRNIYEKDTGRLAKRELLLKNHSEVMYDYSLIPQEQIRKEE